MRTILKGVINAAETLQDVSLWPDMMADPVNILESKPKEERIRNLVRNNS